LASLQIQLLFLHHHLQKVYFMKPTWAVKLSSASLIPVFLSLSKYNSISIFLLDSHHVCMYIYAGIWPESKVFNDHGLGPIPQRWRGKCESGEQFNAKIHCNNKLIGAKYYLSGLLAETGGKFNRTIIQDFKSNRDAIGHGTHTATIAGGSFVPNVSFYGLARGTDIAKTFGFHSLKKLT